MLIKSVKRPWIKSKTQSESDPYYQTQAWKQLRQLHRQGSTIINGVSVSNVFCVECYRNSKRLVLGATADHIKARKDGGEDELTNLQTLCDSCNARKRAIEYQNRIK